MGEEDRALLEAARVELLELLELLRDRTDQTRVINLCFAQVGTLTFWLHRDQPLQPAEMVQINASRPAIQRLQEQARRYLERRLLH